MRRNTDEQEARNWELENRLDRDREKEPHWRPADALEDEDGVDGPFEAAIERAIEDDREEAIAFADRGDS